MNLLIHRKESIILTTIDLIDKYGIHQISTREIAKKQNITEGAIYKHFKSKNELILGVLDYFSQYDSDLFLTAQQKETTEESIIFLVESLSSYYENYPSITAVLLSLEIMRYDETLKSKVEDIYSTWFVFFKKIIQKGQETGEIPPKLSSEMLTDIIIGTCVALCARWRLQQYSFSLRGKCLEAVNTILGSFIQDKINPQRRESID
ncbi:MAG: TetR/AcrR family transcriptional regulator [Dehalobacter sp. 4CP]|uniref:TetR/AcrR family transcriptional regulator n=1 Tax=Dehalobacter sp. CP TaxID=2594474 RepID=UPI000315F271|nr:TetR/AcrR family transcriptional regulator [Dehalobacter sp. 4CP]